MQRPAGAFPLPTALRLMAARVCSNTIADVTRIVALLASLSVATPAVAADGDQWFARDKALHASAGATLGLGGYAAGALVFGGSGKRVASGLVAGIGVGAAKEWHDRGGRGTASWRDLAWDGIGAAAGVTVAWMIDRARRAHRARTPQPTTRNIERGMSMCQAPDPAMCGTLADVRSN